MFTGCDLFEDADDVTFNTTFTLPNDFHIDEDTNVPKNPYVSITSSLEVDQDPQVLKYKDKIKKIRVNKISYEIYSFNAPGAVTLVSGKTTFYEVGGTASTEAVAEVTNLALGNKSGDLTTTQASLDKIGEILLEDGEVMVVSSATLSSTPVEFYVKTIVDVSVTANALD